MGDTIKSNQNSESNFGTLSSTTIMGPSKHFNLVGSDQEVAQGHLRIQFDSGQIFAHGTVSISNMDLGIKEDGYSRPYFIRADNLQDRVAFRLNRDEQLTESLYKSSDSLFSGSIMPISYVLALFPDYILPEELQILGLNEDFLKEKIGLFKSVGRKLTRKTFDNRLFGEVKITDPNFYFLVDPAFRAIAGKYQIDESEW